MMLLCPKCSSTSINQFRMMTGPIWCASCNYREEHKEISNPFLIKLEYQYKDEDKGMYTKLDKIANRILSKYGPEVSHYIGKKLVELALNDYDGEIK